MTMHTEGPWRVSGRCYELGEGLAGVSGPGWNELAGVVVEVNGYLNDEGIANARLIAAAPDLLEALQELCEIVEDAIEQKSAKDLDSFTLQPARAAIAKATGDQP
jgi:hypothetical protein